MSAEQRDLANGWPKDDPLLDACLDEVLGGRTPPDLTARIVRALDGRTAAEAGEPTPPPVAQPARPVPIATTHRSSRSRWIAAWPGAVVAACLLIALMLAAAAALRQQQEPVLVQTPESPEREKREAEHPMQPEIAHQPSAPEAEKRQPTAEDSKPQLAEKSPPGGFDAAPPFAADTHNAEAAPPSESPAYAVAPQPDYDEDVIAFVNRALHQSWEESGVAPSPPATDGEWARRAYLRLIGRTPSYEELAAYRENRSSNKKEELVNRLLYDDQYVEQYARHWSGVWANLLIGRTGGTGKDDLAVREGLQQYLRRSFQFNKPYDQMAFELVSATGANRPGTEEYNGAVNFLLANYTHDFTLVTSKTARVFLGKQLHC
ncbi:MAG: DUF1549 domain-containing protein, partial [Planctomycetes bacterium]|nr:DUF1549 domain-containing protein [Planctomycetota bacterium]